MGETEIERDRNLEKKRKTDKRNGANHEGHIVTAASVKQDEWETGCEAMKSYQFWEAGQRSRPVNPF